MVRQNFYVGGIPSQKGHCYPVMSYQPFKDLASALNSHYQTVWTRRQFGGSTGNIGISKARDSAGMLEKKKASALPNLSWRQSGKT